MEKKINTVNGLRELIAETKKENRDLEKILESYRESKDAFMKAYESGASCEELYKKVVSAKEDAEKFGEKFSGVVTNLRQKIEEMENSDFDEPAEASILILDLVALMKEPMLLGAEYHKNNSEIKKVLEDLI
jgi:hypothetical protein